MSLQIDTTNILLTNSSYNLSQIISQNKSINEILTLIDKYVEKNNLQQFIINLPLLIEKLNLLLGLNLGSIN